MNSQSDIFRLILIILMLANANGGCGCGSDSEAFSDGDNCSCIGTINTCILAFLLLGCCGGGNTPI